MLLKLEERPRMPFHAIVFGEVEGRARPRCRHEGEI